MTLNSSLIKKNSESLSGFKKPQKLDDSKQKFETFVWFSPCQAVIKHYVEKIYLPF